MLQYLITLLVLHATVSHAVVQSSVPGNNMISLPPPAEGSKCYIYYDESTLGFCELFSGGRPGNTWFDGSYVGQTCEERAAWWSGELWHQCLVDPGLPYPGHAVVKVRDDAFYMTIIASSIPNMDLHQHSWPETDLHLHSAWYKCREFTGNPCSWLPSTIGGVPEVGFSAPSELGLTPPEDCAWWCEQEPECKTAWFRGSGNHCSLYNFELPFDQDFTRWSDSTIATKKKQEPTIDETVQITTSGPGQSCDNACGVIEKECVEDMLIHQSAEEVASWALSVGVSCSSIIDRCDIGESPIFNYSLWENENLCTFCSNPESPGWLGGGRCGAKYQIRERICPCTSTPIETTTKPIDTFDNFEGIGRVCRDDKGHQTDGIFESSNVPLDECIAKCEQHPYCIAIEYDQNEIDLGGNGCELHYEVSRSFSEDQGPCTVDECCYLRIDSIEIGDQCVKHADRGPFGMEIGSCCGRPGKISCGPGYTVKPPPVDVCGGSCPESWCNHHGDLANVREYSCEPTEFVQVYGEGSCETLGGYKTITDAFTCELAAKFLDKKDTTVNIHKMHGWASNRPLGCTYHQFENLELWTESTGVCTFGVGCLCEITENIIGDRCVKHADRGPLEMEIGSCCGLPGAISCGPGYVLQAPVPDVCGGSCPESWCNHHGILADAREYSCVPEQPSTEEPSNSPTLTPTIQPTQSPTLLPTTEPTQKEPTIDEIVQITTSEPGQSCDNACGAIEKECVEDMLIHQSSEEVASWALSVGVSCSSIVDRCDIGESPIFNYSLWENENLCTFCSNPDSPGWLGGGRCGAKYQIRERMCPCTSTPIETTTEPIDIIYCDMTLDNVVSHVRYDGVDLEVEGALNMWTRVKHFSFIPVPGAVLEIVGGYEGASCNGCECAGLIVECSNGLITNLDDWEAIGFATSLAVPTSGYGDVCQSTSGMFLSGQSSDAVKIWPSNGEKYAWFRVIPEPENPSTSPSISPTTTTPTQAPSVSSPSQGPSESPSLSPSESPTQSPSKSPSQSPSKTPSLSPTLSPTPVPRDVVLEYHWPTHSYLAAAWYKCKAPCGESSIGGVAVQQTYPPSELNLTPPEQCAWWCQHEPECKVAWFRWSGNDCKLYDFELSFHKQDFESDSSMMLKSCPEGNQVSRRLLQEATQLRHTTSLHNNARSFTMKL